MCVVIMYFSFKYMWIGKTGLKLLGLFFFHMCNSCFRKKEHMCSPLDSDSKSTLIEGQTPAVRLLQERQYFQTSHSVSSQTPPTEKTLTRDAKTYRILNILEFELTIFWPLTQNLSFSFFPFFLYQRPNNGNYACFKVPVFSSELLCHVPLHSGG